MSSIASNDPRVPVTVLTGFLGSGKTTLLNHILTDKSHGKKLAIIENEFGEVGIDDKLIQKNARMQSAETIIEMMNGCICCTVRQDLVVVLKKLAEKVANGLKLDGIIIETTGLADPAPVAQTFFVDEKVKEFARLDGIITLVDAKHIEKHLDEEKPEGAENEAVEQVAFADRLLVNKIDLVTEKELKQVEARLKTINAFAPIVRSEQSKVSVDNVLNIKGFDLSRTLEMDPEFLDTDAEHVHDESIGSLSIQADGDVHGMLINDFISTILQTLGNDIFRMKGVLAIAGSPEKFVYQGVHMIFDGEFQGEWEQGEKRCSKLVFIGKNLNKEALEKEFKKCLCTPENASRIIAAQRIKLRDQLGQKLLSAAHRDDVRAIESLLADGADINWGNALGQTALHIAGLWGNASAVQCLIDNKVDVDKVNGPRLGNQTALQMLASRGKNPANRLLCAQAFVKAGVNLGYKNSEGETALGVMQRCAKEDGFVVNPELQAVLTP